MGARSCDVVREALGLVKGAYAAYTRFVRGGRATGSLNGTRGPDDRELYAARLRLTTLADVLEVHDAPAVLDHLHVDTGGSEAEVLRGFPFHSRCARRVTVAHGRTDRATWRAHVTLEAHGYVFEASDRGADVFYGDCAPFAAPAPRALLALTSPRPGDDRGATVKVAIAADVSVAPEVAADPGAFDVCYDCGFGKICHPLLGTASLPRCNARALDDGVAKVEAWVERRESFKVGRRVYVYLWDDAKVALGALVARKASDKTAGLRLHVGVAHEQLGQTTRAAAEYAAAAALGDRAAAERLDRLLDAKEEEEEEEDDDDGEEEGEDEEAEEYEDEDKEDEDGRRRRRRRRG